MRYLHYLSLHIQFQYFAEVIREPEITLPSTTQQDILTQFVMNATANLLPDTDPEVIHVFPFSFVISHFNTNNLKSSQEHSHAQ